jgi:hypothetical protein
MTNINSTARPARLTAARVIKLMHAGAALHCSYGPVVWALDNGWEVSTPVALKVINHPGIAAMGDGLFGFSQTFRHQN